jgi:hypothetical protein
MSSRGHVSPSTSAEVAYCSKARMSARVVGWVLTRAAAAIRDAGTCTGQENPEPNRSGRGFLELDATLALNTGLFDSEHLTAHER